MTTLAESLVNNKTCPVTVAAFFMALAMKGVGNQKSNVNTDINYEYDFIIVGGGSAGCVVANRLSEVPEWRILLLEAGEEEPSIAQVPAFSNYLDKPEIGIDWGYKYEPNKNFCSGKGCKMQQGKVLGGSSVLNYMIYHRGFKKDYDYWEEMGNTGWKYSEIIKYFIKSEKNKDYGQDSINHGTEGPLSVQKFQYVDKNVNQLIKAFKEIGYEENDMNRNIEVEGVEVEQTTTKDGKRQSTNTAFLKPVRSSRTNLDVVTGVKVTKILIDEDNTAYGVEFERNSNKENVNKERVRATKEVVLSAGAFGSPHILMLSGIGPKNVLEKVGITVQSDLSVGENFQNHVSSSAIRISLSKKSSQIPENIFQCEDDMFQYMFSSGPLSSTGLRTVGAYKKSKIALKYNHPPDIKFHFTPVYNGTAYMTNGNNTACAVNNDTLIPMCYYNGFHASATILRPVSRGYVTLNTSYPLEKLIINDNMLNSPDDLTVLMEGVFFLKNLTKTKAFEEAEFSLVPQLPPECTAEKFDSESYWQCVTKAYAYPIHHPCCTCKMGPSSDKSAVVNDRLQVYGINGLRVIDASVMPEIISGNTNAPVIMIAEKGSDIIKDKWLVRSKKSSLSNASNEMLLSHYILMFTVCFQLVINFRQ